MGIYHSIVRREKIEKGWSGDEKYRIEAEDGQQYLLRVSPPSQAERKKRQFLRMQAVSDLGIPMCLPMEFGTCQEGVYTIQSWIQGADAEDWIPSLGTAEQYQYGLEAGRILEKIHSLPAPPDTPDWESRFNAKIDRKIDMYTGCPLKFHRGENAFLGYIRDNRHLLCGRPQSYQHGDYHIGNMMIDLNGKLIVIDFDRDDYGDPWEEFNRIVWSAQEAPSFATGMVDGYFEGTVPPEFWKLLALYICSNTLSSLPWAIPFGDEEIQIMRTQAEQILQWYDDMNNTVPSWYHQTKAALRTPADTRSML